MRGSDQYECSGNGHGLSVADNEVVVTVPCDEMESAELRIMG